MKKIISTILSVVMTLSLILGSAEPVRGAASSDRVQQLLNQMTLEQKVGQMLQPDTRSITPDEVGQYYIGSILSGGGASPSTGNTAADWAARSDEYQKAAIESFGIPLLYGVDAVHGHNNVADAVMFPHNVGLGQSGNAELVSKIAEITAKEVRATGANWVFTPTLGLPHNERWGRAYECYGENAELSAKLGAAYVTGSQGAFAEYNAIATAKHFIGEGIATDGVNQGDIPYNYDDAEFQEYLENELLIPYQSAIAAGVKSVMITYNSLNGVKCHGHEQVITDLLKNRLGFEGIVISDYNGIDQIEGDLTYAQKVQKSVNAGLDMLMLDGTEGTVAKWKAARQAIIDGVNSGIISMDRINDAVTRILNVKDDMGLLENPESAYANTELLANFACDEYKAVARQAVSESLTLLKNTATQNGASTIMQDLADMDKLIVAGLSADDIGMQCGGWTIWWQGFSGAYTEGTTIYEGLKEVAGSGTAIDLAVDGSFTGTDYDAAIVVVGEAPYAEYAGDRAEAELKLSDADVEAINTIHEEHPDLPIIAVLTTGRPITIANQIDLFDAVIMAGFPGSEGAGVADVLLGDQDFSGHLTFTWPWYAQDIEEKFTDSSKVLFEYGRGLTKAETTAIATEKPEDPTMVDLGETNGILEAESYASASSGVILENSGTTVGYFWTDRELVYKVNVPESGIYNIAMSTATNNSSVDVAMDIYVDGTLAGSVSKELTSTGGWAAFADMDLGVGLELLSGTHTLTFVSRSQDYNIDRFIFTKTGDVEGGITVDLGETNGVLEAESYYTKHADIVLENDGTTVGYFWEDRDIVYKVNVPESGVYEMVMSAATDNASVDVAVDIYVDDTLAGSVSKELTNTGGWSVFADLDLDMELELSSGIHTLKFVSRSRDFNMDKFEFAKIRALESGIIVDLGETNGVLEAENYYTKHADIILENDDTTVGYFWEDRDIVYRVNVPESSTYKMIMSAATDNASADVAMDIYVDGTLAGSVSKELTSTGGWAVFEELDLGTELELSSGIHTLTFISRSRDFNVDKFTFVNTSDNESAEESTEESSEGIETEPSQPEVVTPSKVTGLQAVYENGQIRLTWDDNGAAQYRVMRFDGINDGYTTLTYRAAADGYIDTDLIDVHRYFYRVCGYFYNEEGKLVQGSVSDSVGIVATDREPSKVENVTASISDGTVTLNWDAADGVRYYKIARAYGATPSEGSYACLKYNVEETTYTDTKVSGGTWRYKVVGYYKAVDGSWAYGDMSNTLFVTVK